MGYVWVCFNFAIVFKGDFMNFYEFANLLYEVLGGGSKPAFVRLLFESIVLDTDFDAQSIIEDYSDDAYKSYIRVNNRNDITRIARQLISHLEPENFADFIDGFTYDAWENLCIKFKPYIPEIDVSNVGKSLAELFMQIIKNAATSKRSNSKKNNSKKAKVRTTKGVPSTSNKTQQVVPTIQDTETSNQNINFSNQNKLLGINAEMMKALQSFSKDYYQLIVTCDEDIFNTNTVFVIPSRALTKNGVPPEIFERCSALTSEGIEELKHIPAIICTENKDYKGITSPEQSAIFAYIKDIKKCGNNIKISFQSIDVIKQLELCSKENAPHFDINIDCAITDLNISAWTVHKVNLLKALKETNIQMPSRALWEMYCYNG